MVNQRAHTRAVCLRLICFFCLINLISCGSPDDPGVTYSSSELHGGVRDSDYVLLMITGDEWKISHQVYEYLVCEIGDDKEPTDLDEPTDLVLDPLVSSTSIGHTSRSYRTKLANPQLEYNRRLKRLIQSGSKDDYHALEAAVLNFPTRVLVETCTPAFRGHPASGAEPMSLVGTGVDQDEQAVALGMLDNERFHIEVEQGKHFVSAFGIGAAISSFNKHTLNPFRQLIPKKFHQVSLRWIPGIERLQKVPVLGRIVPLNLGVPGFSEYNVSAFALGQNEPFEAFSRITFDFQNFSNRTRPDKNLRHPVVEVSGVVASGAVGFITGRHLVRFVANLASQHAPGAVGHVGVIFTGLLLPLLTSAYTFTRENAAQDILDNFQPVVTAVYPPTGELLETHVPDSIKVGSSIEDILPILGRILVLAEWVSYLNLHSYCLPADNADGYTCKEVGLSEF